MTEQGERVEPSSGMIDLVAHGAGSPGPERRAEPGPPEPDANSGWGAAGPRAGEVERSFVYALGRVDPRFASLAAEKEFAQATGRADTAGLTDRQALQSVLSERANRYLARQMCWVFTVEGLETYILAPRDPPDLELLIEALRPAPRRSVPADQLVQPRATAHLTADAVTTRIRADPHGPSAPGMTRVRSGGGRSTDERARTALRA